MSADVSSAAPCHWHRSSPVIATHFIYIRRIGVASGLVDRGSWCVVGGRRTGLVGWWLEGRGAQWLGGLRVVGRSGLAA